MKQLQMLTDFSNVSQVQVKCVYSGTPPYDHPVYKTTSLLRPYSFKPNVKTIESFYYFEDPVNATTSLLRPGFYGPTVVALTGFHCMLNKKKGEVNLYEIPAHFIHEIKTKGYDFIGVNVFLPKLMKFLPKKLK